MCVLWAAGCGFSVRSATNDAATNDVSDALDSKLPFDPATCGATYPITIGASRYRIEQTTTLAWTAHELCAADLAGATHLAVIDDLTERDMVQRAINDQVAGTDTFWVGGVQKLAATEIGGDWLALTGGPMIAGAWALDEPTDDDGAPPYTSEAHAEQFVRLNRNGIGLVDAPGRVLHGFVCECDGKPIDSVAAKAVTDSTM